MNSAVSRYDCEPISHWRRPDNINNTRGETSGGADSEASNRVVMKAAALQYFTCIKSQTYWTSPFLLAVRRFRPPGAKERKLQPPGGWKVAKGVNGSTPLLLGPVCSR